MHLQADVSEYNELQLPHVSTLTSRIAEKKCVRENEKERGGVRARERGKDQEKQRELGLRTSCSSQAVGALLVKSRLGELGQSY